MNPVTLIQILKYFTRYKLDHGIHDMYGNIDSDIILLRVAEKCRQKSVQVDGYKNRQVQGIASSNGLIQDLTKSLW